MPAKARTAATTQPKPVKRPQVFEQDSEEESELDSAGDSEQELEEVEAESDSNAPRYAQFMDESDLEAATDDEDESESDLESDDVDESEADEADLQRQMKSVPFSALMKARAQMNDYDDDEPNLSDLEPDEFEADRKRLSASNQSSRTNGADIEQTLEQRRNEVKERLRQLNASGPSNTTSNGNSEWETRRALREERHKEAHARQELEKRAHKHAPTEMSSKKPVSRRRNVVETNSKQIRDPRFESLSGSENKDLFTKSYSFLPDMFKDELTTLKKTLAKLKKQEAAQAGPKARSDQALALRDERAKVEIALRRAEGLAGERERRLRESEVKGKIKAQNRERVEKGQLPFYPKRTEVRQMLLKDKYDRLSGGNQDGKQATGVEKKQLKKALERRRRKNAQKEKKDMPAGIGYSGSGGNAGVPKRKREWGAAEQPKRTRV